MADPSQRAVRERIDEPCHQLGGRARPLGGRRFRRARVRRRGAREGRLPGHVRPAHAGAEGQRQGVGRADQRRPRLQLWAAAVNRDGFICQVTFSGKDRNAQWPGSRLIAAQKAYAANAFSLDSFALSTANLYGTTQPGGSLWGLQFSNLLSTPTAYQGNPSAYGTANDPLDGGKVGGLIVFGGGLALYDKGKHIVGALGVSGDTSCADHNVAWRVRKAL